MNLSENQELLPESILTSLVLCSLMKEKQDPALPAESDAVLHFSAQFDGPVTVLVPQVQLVHCCILSIPGWQTEALLVLLMTFQLSESTPVPVVLERATVQWQHWNLSETSRKIPSGTDSNRVQNSSGEVKEKKPFLKQTLEWSRAKPAHYRDLTDIKWFG